MSVAGKKAYKVYLTEEAADYLSARMETKPGSGGLSALLDEMVVNLYRTLKAAGIKEGKKFTWASLLRMLIEGLLIERLKKQ
jgi:hypothetical protein